MGLSGKNVELTLDRKNEHRNSNHNCGAINLVGDVSEQPDRKTQKDANLVCDVIEGPGDIDQHPGMTAEFLLCTYVRRTRSRLWDMTSLGLHQSTPTCGSFLRFQGGGPQIRAATSPQQLATLRNLISLAVSRLNRLSGSCDHQRTALPLDPQETSNTEEYSNTRRTVRRDTAGTTENAEKDQRYE